MIGLLPPPSHDLGASNPVTEPRSPRKGGIVCQNGEQWEKCRHLQSRLKSMRTQQGESQHRCENIRASAWEHGMVRGHTRREGT